MARRAPPCSPRRATGAGSFHHHHPPPPPLPPPPARGTGPAKAPAVAAVAAAAAAVADAGARPQGRRGEAVGVGSLLHGGQGSALPQTRGWAGGGAGRRPGPCCEEEKRGGDETSESSIQQKTDTHPVSNLVHPKPKKHKIDSQTHIRKSHSQCPVSPFLTCARPRAAPRRRPSPPEKCPPPRPDTKSGGSGAARPTCCVKCEGVFVW